MAVRKSTPRKKGEKLTLGLSVISLVVTIVLAVAGLWYNQQGIKASKYIADRSIAFDRADNYLGFANFDLPPPAQQDTIRLIYGVDFEKDAVNISALPFSIFNSGHKTAEKVRLTIDYPAKALMAFTDTALLRAHKQPYAKFTRTLMEDGEHQYITYELAELDPALQVTLDEPIVLHQTEVSDRVRTKDGVPVPYRFLFSFIFSTTLMGKDMNTQKQVFSFTCIPSRDMSDLVDRFVAHHQLGDRKKVLYYFVYPEDKRNIDRRNDRAINEYRLGPHSLAVGAFDHTKVDKIFPLGLYNQTNKLYSVRLYDEHYRLKKVFPVK